MSFPVLQADGIDEHHPVHARGFPRATLVEFPDLGHAPQIQDPAQFHRALLEALR